MIERTTADVDGQTPPQTITGFPLYDAHGNDVATLTRSGSGGYNVGDRRSYDAWGVVRAQQSGGDPQLRHCASLGHKADDESGLVYMRARYYDPSCGRFVSEDPGSQGRNWFAYCSSDPVNRTDNDGKIDQDAATAAIVAWISATLKSKYEGFLKSMLESLAKKLAGAAGVVAANYMMMAGQTLMGHGAAMMDMGAELLEQQEALGGGFGMSLAAASMTISGGIEFGIGVTLLASARVLLGLAWVEEASG